MWHHTVTLFFHVFVLPFLQGAQVYKVPSFLLSSEQPCEVGEAEGDWPKVIQEASWLSWDLNLGLPHPIPKLSWLPPSAVNTCCSVSDIIVMEPHELYFEGAANKNSMRSISEAYQQL